ncbi:hypothetical protein ACH4PR_51590 [Streptomyces mirabilis]|uniref:hypothetical protein n=1 Tax=Streptomyces mirabilis TaxID=68239 RepID=UPI00378A75C4
MPNAESGGPGGRQGLSYYPWWLDNLAEDATLEGGAMNGTARGAEAARAIVVKARELYEFQDFSFTGDFGNNGFLEIYNASVQGEPLKVVVTVTRNAAGQAQNLAVLHRPRNSLLLFSRLMHEKFAGARLAEHFLADKS